MKVLILEDNETCRKSLVKIVKSCMNGIKVYDFEKREDAYLRAMDDKIDLFLVDIILRSNERNDSSGIQFADDIREHSRYKMTPIIFVTTLQGLEPQLVKRVHCYDYIEKPLGDGSIFRRRIMEVLEAIVSDRKTKKKECMMLRCDGISYPVYPENVIYVVSRRGVLNIHLKDDVIRIPNLTTSKFLERVKESVFLTPMHGVAVNAKYIRGVDFPRRCVYLKGTEEVLNIGGRVIKRFRKECDEVFWGEGGTP
ncbi:MAG: response regulator [Roseburia sp.]|nr:response regulator [Roseburia sp.]